jgi:hypothetical protein
MVFMVESSIKSTCFFRAPCDCSAGFHGCSENILSGDNIKFSSLYYNKTFDKKMLQKFQS